MILLFQSMNFRSQKGMALLEIIIALAIFSFVMAGLVSLIAASLINETLEQDILVGQAFASEGFAAVESIKNQGWENLNISQSGVSTLNGYWQWKGEGTTDVNGKFLRIIKIFDVWRDSSGQIVEAGEPGAVIDADTKNISVEVSWLLGPAEKNMTSSQLLTNWRSLQWLQSDWSGGDGQEMWLGDGTFNDYSFINFSVFGELSLEQRPGKKKNYRNSGWLESAAYNSGNNNVIWRTISWSEDLSGCLPDCSIRVQFSTAPDENGAPGNWSSWSGPNGVGDYYITGTETPIFSGHGGQPWARYRIELGGSGAATPIFQAIKINY